MIVIPMLLVFLICWFGAGECGWISSEGWVTGMLGYGCRSAARFGFGSVLSFGRSRRRFCISLPRLIDVEFDESWAGGVS